jgi:hypothetical protein
MYHDKTTIGARRIGRAALALLALVIAGLAALSPQPSAAQTSQRCFAETGFCISGSIRAYWERNGGLAVFGYPITNLHDETIEGSWTGPVQWFERDRLEDHSGDGQGVLAGRLGAQSLELQGHPWQTLPGAPGPGDPQNCTYFPETAHILCGELRAYWQRNGGLARFGYPITERFTQTIEGRQYTVQYFERRRMELHLENAGTPYAVLLGLLGRDVYAATGGTPAPPTSSNDLAGYIQQPILDTAWAKVKPDYKDTPLMLGLVDVAGDYAWVLAQPYGRDMVHVYLKRQGERWQVLTAVAVPMPDALKKYNIPQSLQEYNDRFAVTIAKLGQAQDPRGSGLNGYLTRPRVSGDYARLWVVPAASAQLDPASTFFKRDLSTWKFLTAGSAFPEDDLRKLGVPRDLWPYGDSVRGPA